MFFVIDFTLLSDILSLAISTIFTPSVSISSVCPSYVFAFIVCFTYPLYCSVSLFATVPSIGISFISSEISVIARVGVPAVQKNASRFPFFIAFAASVYDKYLASTILSFKPYADNICFEFCNTPDSFSPSDTLFPYKSLIEFISESFGTATCIASVYNPAIAE